VLKIVTILAAVTRALALVYWSLSPEVYEYFGGESSIPRILSLIANVLAEGSLTLLLFVLFIRQLDAERAVSARNESLP
jgi:hypothetical protein